MAEELIIVDRRRQTFAKTMENERRLKQEAAASLYCSHRWPDLQNVLRQSCDYLTIMPELRSTNDGRLMFKIS